MGCRSAFALLLICLFFVFWIDFPAVRYTYITDDIDCTAHQMAGAPDRIDLLVLGTSRFRQGLLPDILERESAGHLNKAYNFSRSNLDIFRAYSILEDLDRRGVDIGYVLLEVDLESLGRIFVRKDVVDYNVVGFVGYANIFDIPEILNYSPKAYRITLESVVNKLRHGIIRHLTGHIFSALSVMNDKKEADKVCRWKGLDKSTEGFEIEKAKRLKSNESVFGNLSIALDDRFQFLQSDAAALDLFYINKIRDLLKKKNAKLYISRLWGYSDPPLSQEAIQRVLVLLPEFIYPPSDFVRHHSNDFMDATHMNIENSEAYSKWVAGVVSSKEK